MITILKETQLAFDDVLLQPAYSDIESRASIDISTEVHTKLTIPIISSPMDTITENRMATAMAKSGAGAIIHRFNNIDVQADEFLASPKTTGCAIGAVGDYLERAMHLQSVGCNFFCIDVAHGHHELVGKALDSLRKKLKTETHVMAGSVATAAGGMYLLNHGADSLRVGIGGGSICSTRIMTGHGIPTLQSIIDVSALKDRHDGVKIIADGGIRTPGDIVKALAAGADAVMLGSMLSGTEETPGDIISTKSGDFKHYRGMASQVVQVKSNGKTKSVEGIATMVKFNGKLVGVLDMISQNVKSGLSYSGVRSIEELQTKAVFIKQTLAGMKESQPHINEKV